MRINLDKDNSDFNDTFNDAFVKCNENFELIGSHLKIKLNHIYWHTLKDNREAFSDINNNFEKIFKHLKI